MSDVGFRPLRGRGTHLVPSGIAEAFHLGRVVVQAIVGTFIDAC